MTTNRYVPRRRPSGSGGNVRTIAGGSLPPTLGQSTGAVLAVNVAGQASWSDLPPQIQPYVPGHDYRSGDIVLLRHQEIGSRDTWALWRAQRPTSDSPTTGHHWEQITGQDWKITEWNSLTEYPAGSIVLHDGSLWRTSMDVHIPPADHDYLVPGTTVAAMWKEVASSTPGPTGPIGPKGNDGAAGPPGTAVTIKAAVATVANLPPTAAVEEVHFVTSTGDLMVYVGPGLGTSGPAGHTDEWLDLGHVQGPAGSAGTSVRDVVVNSTGHLDVTLTDGTHHVTTGRVSGHGIFAVVKKTTPSRTDLAASGWVAGDVGIWFSPE